MKQDVTQRVEFECVYVMRKEINAHRYKMEVTVECPQRSEDGGLILDFKSLRNYISSIVPDKHFIYSYDSDSTVIDPDGLDLACKFNDLGYPVSVYSFHLSCENLCDYFACELQSIFNTKEPGLIVSSVKLRENNDSYASWHM